MKRKIESKLLEWKNKVERKPLLINGARASTYEYAIEWLVTAGIAYKCTKSKKGELPLKMSEDFLSYKIYMSDIGLLSTKNCEFKNNIKSVPLYAAFCIK